MQLYTQHLVLVMLGIVPRASCIPGTHSVTWETSSGPPPTNAHCAFFKEPKRSLMNKALGGIQAQIIAQKRYESVDREFTLDTARETRKSDR